MDMRTFRKYRFLSELAVVIFGGCLIVCADVQDISSEIERIADLEGDEFEREYEILFNRVLEDTAGIASAVLPKLNNDNLNDKTLALYVAVLGITGAPEAIDEICRLSLEAEADLIRYNCYRALAQIGGEKAGKCILSSLGYISDADERFEIYNLLGQIQYEPALSMMQEILEKDAEELYWQPIFVFGKMGDVAVPHLIENIDHDNVNVRFNAINILGQWLIAPEATQSLQARFWEEKDPIIRNLILSSIEKISPDNEGLEVFMKKVISRTEDENSKKFAQETIQLFKSKSAEIEETKSAKKISSEEFRKQYDIIWKSYGLEGDYNKLISASTYDNEPELKKLRERILQRNSDEAFYDYDRVNEAIFLNRLLNNLE